MVGQPVKVAAGLAAAGLLIGGAMVVFALIRNGERAREDARQAEIAAQNSAAAEADRQNARALAAAAASASANRVAWANRYASMGPDERKANAIVCGATLCPTSTELLGSAKDEKERTTLLHAMGAGRVQAAAQRGRDGSTPSPAVITTASDLSAEGAEVLSLLPKTSYGQAKKATDDERGKVLPASGNVIQIKSSGGVEEGIIMLDGGGLVYFVSPFRSKVTEGQWASFRGVVVQEYDYENAMHGSSSSILVVGKFD